MSNSPKRKVPGPTQASDVFMGTLLQAARKYLFIQPHKKAVFYLVAVILISLFAAYYPPSEGYYLASKNNIFNRYGTKVGWFWTLVTVGPFMWLTSYLHHKNQSEALKHLTRLAIATGFWYFVTHTFIHVEKITGRCVHHKKEGANPFNRDECSVAGGKWAPGTDISGHAYLLIYCALIISEEAKSFMNWPTSPNKDLKVSSSQQFDEHKLYTNSVQWLFLILFFFHIFWDIQLFITLIFYHTVHTKVLGAAAAIACWAITYRFWYPLAFPGGPINRKIKSF